MVYIREAHPSNGRQTRANVRDGWVVEDPETDAERRKLAREFAEEMELSLPILVDGIDDKVNREYAAWPDRIYVIDRKGNIAYKGGPGPRGFRVSDVPPVLEKLLEE